MLLGLKVTREDIKLREDKIHGFHEYAGLFSYKNRKAFLRLVNSCRRFNPHEAEPLLPVTGLLCSNPSKLILTDAFSGIVFGYQIIICEYHAPDAPICQGRGDALSYATSVFMQQLPFCTWEQPGFYS